MVQSKVIVPNMGELRREILEEAHRSAYIIYPGTMKIYQDLSNYIGGMHKEGHHKLSILLLNVLGSKR